MDTSKSAIFSVLDREYPFGGNLVQKIKIVSLSRNLVPTLIQRYAKLNIDAHFFEILF